MSACRLVDPLRLKALETPFPGSQPAGTHFYDRYLLDVPAETFVRVEAVVGTLPIGADLLAYREDGAFVAHGRVVTSGSVVINNNSTETRRYQIILTTWDPGDTGTYGIMANVLQ